MGNNKKKQTGKIRVDFKRNRNAKTRSFDWTRRYYDGLASSSEIEHETDAKLFSEGGSDENESERSSSQGVKNRLKRRAFDSDVFDAENQERVQAKGDLARKRTIIGSYIGTENLSGEFGDFNVVPEVDYSVCLKGRALSVHGLYSYVEDEQGRVFTCVTRRILKTLATNQRQVVVAGDRVYFRDAQLPDGRLEGIIESVEPRYGAMSRSSWKRKHVVVANVEQAVIMTSAAEPRIKPNLVDRLLVTCERSSITPIICINKVDLVDPASLQPLVGVYSKMGYRTILFSARTGFNLERLRRALIGRESVVVGQSGVGKSSALNALDPSLNLRVNEVSRENEKGRHTTTAARLLKLSFGGYVVDTPGVRQFMLWDILPNEVVGYYRDLRPYENLCRYPNCAHLNEGACAVKDSVADGRLDARRYESYLALRAGKMEGWDKLE